MSRIEREFIPLEEYGTCGGVNDWSGPCGGCADCLRAQYLHRINEYLDWRRTRAIIRSEIRRMASSGEPVGAYEIWTHIQPCPSDHVEGELRRMEKRGELIALSVYPWKQYAGNSGGDWPALPYIRGAK